MTSMNKIICAAFITKDGEVFLATGFGAEQEIMGEITLNSSVTGYQEVLTDPNNKGKIIVFTFPHIGNVGANAEDKLSDEIQVSGVILRNLPTEPSNWRAEEDFVLYLKKHNKVGLCHIDTRALASKIKTAGGSLYGIIAYNEKGLDIERLQEHARSMGVK